MKKDTWNSFCFSWQSWNELLQGAQFYTHKLKYDVLSVRSNWYRRVRSPGFRSDLGGQFVWTLYFSQASMSHKQDYLVYPFSQLWSILISIGTYDMVHWFMHFIYGGNFHGGFLVGDKFSVGETSQGGKVSAPIFLPRPFFKNILKTLVPVGYGSLFTVVVLSLQPWSIQNKKIYSCFYTRV